MPGVQFDSNIDLDVWYIDVLEFIGNYWIAILITIIFGYLTIALFQKIISPHLFEFYKRMLKFDNTLKEMKQLLETDYGELWTDPEFCLAFLKLHEGYQTFLNSARSDYSGRMSRVSPYNKYAFFQMK